MVVALLLPRLAAAEPEVFNDPAYYASDIDVGIAGDPFPSNSWTQSFVIKGDLAKIEDPWMYINAGFDMLRGLKLTTDWDYDPDYPPARPAINEFVAYPEPWVGANPESWGQTAYSSEVFVAMGHTDNPDPDNEGQVPNGLQFDLSFEGEQEPGVKFELQVLAKKYDRATGAVIGYQVRKDFVFWWDGDVWLRAEVNTDDWSLLSKQPKAPEPFGEIPEPFSMAFLGSAFLGVVGFGAWRRRREGMK